MRKVTAEEFVQRSNAVHGGKFDYSKSIFKTTKGHLKIDCPEHGTFTQAAGHHMRGQGCPKCKVGKISKALIKRFQQPEFRALCGVKLRSNAEEFTRRAKEVHGAAFDYSEVTYVNAITPVKIRCFEHGVFSQRPMDHLLGKGCTACYRKRQSSSRLISLEVQLDRAKKLHGGKYQYPGITAYSGTRDMIDVVCPKHGKFTVLFTNHIYGGSGCPRCGHTVSKGETDLWHWIKYFCPDVEQSNRHIIKPFELDIVVPSKKIAVEYNGMHWHACKPGEESDADRIKLKKAADAGYQLFTVWECDWVTKKEVVCHWLRHKLGFDVRLCSARETKPNRVPSVAANDFYEKYHLQGAPPAGGATFGLEYKGGWVAMATFTRSAERNQSLEEGCYYFSRLAFAGSVPGAASKLFKYSVEQLKAREIYAHSDNSYADGGVKALLGFEKDGELVPRYRVWHPKYGIRHRSFWQKSKIPKRMQELGIEGGFDPETSTTIDGHRITGCKHVWDCGKTRWVWKAA